MDCFMVDICKNEKRSGLVVFLLSLIHILLAYFLDFQEILEGVVFIETSELEKDFTFF